MRFFSRASLVFALLWTANSACYSADADLADIKAEVTKRHDEAVKRLQDWIKQVSIAAEDRGFPEGAEYMAKLAKDAGFQQATVIKTDGKPGVFATLDAGAAKTVGLYFMYDVKQFDPAEWKSPPLEARDRRQAELRQGDGRSRGGESEGAAVGGARGAACDQGRGEEDAGEPGDGGGRRGGDRFAAHRATCAQAGGESGAAKCVGVFMPSAMQDLDGVVTVNLGAKGVVELELVSSGEKWGRGPAKDVHSSLKAMIDSPSWHLVKALDTLVSEDGNNIAIDNYPKPRPLSADEKEMIAKVSKVRDEAKVKEQYSMKHWIDDLPLQQALERLESQPTVNIEGLVGGYTGPGGKTILPHRAAAKLDLRLVPDMKTDDAWPR